MFSKAASRALWSLFVAAVLVGYATSVAQLAGISL
jgi:hypothetical protein